MYSRLHKILIERNEFLDSNLFKSILSVCKRMTDLNYTKQDAIKISAKKFKVTQKEIKKYVDLLGIESKRYIESKKTFLTKEDRINIRAHKQRLEAND
ncbi:hypothetical protein ABD72_12665 [Brevibacillus laterosporus]|uniref:Uncharacterized protein n=2 Tax=Brevibacillus laterosporus TaxID=1465 RepID=A0AAP8Q9X3_BRELA|nr:hypothetical protein [Brevibacillus laterosporus]MBG9802996.1 hypothetical protein [Brevibacillus laterosporus]PPA85481.1 hypothetical protein C4A76_16285 [Brevibacillus laterosporus]PPA90113.1 hypothetical protein C4A77_25430 [Brevibacillus laterosporus]TPH22784.1 hypothetical protein EGH09_00950 [Brevibacillus laterosporus]